MIPFETFCRTHRGQSLEAFQEAIAAPVLYIPTLARRGQQDAGFRTVNFDKAGATLKEDRPVVLPIAKRDGSNAFGMMITLGRAPNNDLVIPDQRISKFHAYFRQDGDAWTVSDANSSNGTNVDGAQLKAQTAHPVRSGSLITLSQDLELIFLRPPELFARVQLANART